jgi:hypothetical protein
MTNGSGKGPAMARLRVAATGAVLLLPLCCAALAQSVMGPSTPRLAPRAAGEPPRVKDEPPSTLAFRGAAERLADALDGVAYSGDPDRDFAARAAPLQRALVELARIELQYGADPATRQSAQRLLAAQQDRELVK